MPDLAEMDRVQAVDLDDEGGLLAGLDAMSVIAIGPDASHQDLLDLVLARPVQHECALQAGGQERAAIPRMLAFGAGQRGVVRVAEGDDVATDPASRRPHDRLVRIGHHDRVLTPNPDARSAVPGELHPPDSDTPTCTAAPPRIAQRSGTAALRIGSSRPLGSVPGGHEDRRPG